MHRAAAWGARRYLRLAIGSGNLQSAGLELLEPDRMPAVHLKSSEDGRKALGMEHILNRPLELVLASVSEFRTGFDESFSAGGVFCPTRRKVAVGTLVTVRVRLGRRQPPVLLLGKVAWRRPGRHLEKIRAGIAVEFLPSEQTKCDYVLNLASGEAVRSRRRHERLPCDLGVSVHLPGSSAGINVRMLDVGRGGAAMISQQPIPGDIDLILEVSPPGAQIAMEFTARVAWTSTSADHEIGVGVEWRARDAGGAKRIKEMVRRLAALSPHEARPV